MVRTYVPGFHEALRMMPPTNKLQHHAPSLRAAPTNPRPFPFLLLFQRIIVAIIAAAVACASVNGQTEFKENAYTLDACPLERGTYTKEHLDAEDALPISDISDGNWHCAKLLAWKKVNVCNDPTVQHYDWARNCPINCAKANGAVLVERYSNGLECEGVEGTCTFPTDAAMLKPCNFNGLQGDSGCTADHADLIAGNDGCCSESHQCYPGEGDCDSDVGCKGSATCGTNNCPWGDGDDCCDDGRKQVLDL